MNVSLGDRWEQFVASKVEDGEFQSASEVLRAALRLLHENDEQRAAKLDALRRDIEEGRRAIQEGRSAEFDQSAVDRIKLDGRRKAGLTE